MRNVPELNGLRGIAVLAVFLHHACYANLGSVVAPGWSPEIRVLGNISKYGDSGVDLFFVLSGFLITSILLRDRRSATYYRDFYWKRLLRIGPVLVAALIVTLLLHEFRFALISLFVLANFGPQLHAFGTAPFWSLAIEEQFYLMWPTAIRRMKLRALKWAAIAIILGAVLLRYLFELKGHSNYHLTFLRVDTLAMGALFAALLHEHRPRAMLSSLIASLFSAGMVCLAICRYGTRPNEATRELGIGLVCASIVFFSIAFSGIALLAPLRGKLLLFFAEISYAMYLFHLFLFRVYDGHFGLPAVGDERAYWVRLAVLLLGSIGVAVLSRYVIELPALSLRTRVLPHPRVIDPAIDPPLPLAQM